MSGASKILIGSGGVDLPSDDEFDNVSFLSHFDGANNGTNIVYDDGSASNHTISVGGTPSQGTFGPFARPDGEWSTEFYGGSTGVIAPSSTDFTLDGAYTIEFFINLKSTATQYFFAIGDTINANDIEFGLLSGTTLRFYQGGYTSMSTGSELTVNTWHHVAVTRNGSNLVTGWVDGTALGTTLTETDDADGAVTIGNTFYNGSIDSNGCQGFISNFRILKGTCLYTSNFTAPTSALTAITNTKLLTCQSNRFVDNSASAHAITVTGTTPKASAFTPILTSEAYDSAVNGASAYFDGSGDYLSAADSADWTLGDTFTIEAWIYPPSLAAYNTVVEQNGASGFYYSALSSGAMQFYKGIGGAVQVDSAAVLIKNQWNHVAFVVSSGTGYHYINGARSGSSGSIDIGDIGAALQIGQQGGDWPFSGYISNVRVVNGTAVYSGTTYTVPTAPLTAITNTKLLLNMADGQALDSAAQNNLTLYGTADTSTTQQKFGTSSLFLEGDSDTDFVQLHGVRDFTGPFTIECWARAADTGNAYMWCNGQYTMEFGLSGNNLLLYTAAGASGNFFTGGEFTVNTWHHVAVVRDTSNVIKCYLNGTASGTTFTNSTAFVATQGIFIIGGEWRSATQIYHGWDGYIDDFRISRFARYTSNFTAPTEAFPDKGQ